MTRLSPHLNADYDLPVPQIDMADGVPRARDFDDSYYNADDGLAETRYVFLAVSYTHLTLPTILPV